MPQKNEPISPHAIEKLDQATTLLSELLKMSLPPKADSNVLHAQELLLQTQFA
ncbi:MAG: hypothetical protein WC365_07505 [Candidatus Babeliales bacterium]|jgi:hypothetical protein